MDMNITPIQRVGSKSPKLGGPGHVRQPFISDDVPTDEDMEAAIAVLRYTADEDIVRAKIKTTLIYRQAMVNDADKSADLFGLPTISGHTRTDRTCLARSQATNSWRGD
ncbi:hypothetical protein AOLI_G00180780 [Acnodon oligacanthus]